MWRIRTRDESVKWFSFLDIIVSIIKQWTHWIWKTFLYWILFSSELLAWFFEFSLTMNLLIQWLEKKMTLRVRIRDEKTSWRWRLSFTIVNVFFHARNHASFMREMLVSRIIIIIINSYSLWHRLETTHARNTIYFTERKILKKKKNSSTLISSSSRSLNDVTSFKSRVNDVFDSFIRCHF
jgi:hypothetical protein